MKRLRAAGPAAEFALKLSLDRTGEIEQRRRIELLLRQVASAREATIKNLISKFQGEDTYQTFLQLVALGAAAEPKLREMLNWGYDPHTVTPGYIRWAIQHLNMPHNDSTDLSPVQALRRLAILEKIGTSEVRRVLRELADGPAEAHLTRLARQALKRLGESNKETGP
jgi:hypothetical protein